jgi:unsaturated rhamnogalacturonyl hydrolase
MHNFAVAVPFLSTEKGTEFSTDGANSRQDVFLQPRFMKTAHRRHLFSLLPLAVLLAAPACHAVDSTPAKPSQTEFNGATPLVWSVRMANSETARRGNKLSSREGSSAKWDYTAGLFTLSLLKLNEVVPTPDYVAFSENAIGSFISSDGSIEGYKPAEYNIDNIAPGKTAIALYELTKDEKYRKCADLLRKQLETHPRTSQGGFWHKKRYPSQMWLDGLFMGAPFYAEYTADFHGPAKDFDDVVNQFKLIDEHLYDKSSGLYFHGWDEKKAQDWANPVTGTSSNFWGRGLGWFAMAQVDVLDFLPKDQPGRKLIIDQIKKTADGIVKWQDPESGLWWQVLDKGDKPGNYLEATASSMFVYSMAKAVNNGYLSRDYVPAILKGYNGIVTRLIKGYGGNGQISLTKCCAVAGLGYGRDGSYEYYLREPVVDNDLKGVGPFILAGIEVQKLLGLPISAPEAQKKAESAGVKSVATEWSQVTEILSRIHEPVIPGRDFSIADYGAAADGKTDSSEAIAKAIDAAVKAGGGRVVVPAGEYLTGPIRLWSKIELHLDGGATLKFKTDPVAYLPAVRSWFEGMECYNYSPLIYAYGAENVAITGDGVLDGQADETNWWPWKGKKDFGWKDGAPKQDNARKRLVKMVEDGTPVEDRKFGGGDYLRSSFIEPFRCKTVLIEGVRIRRSPMWELHPVLSTNVIVRGVHIESHGPNNDGCDPEACKDVLIEDTVFDTGDDCIAIKSGRNNDGRRIGVPAENHVIRRCTMKEGHGGVTIGSEISGGARNIFVEDCNMDSPNLDRAIRIKSNAVRGGTMENIFVRNVKVGAVGDAVLQIDFVYEEGANGPFKPVVRKLVIENMTVEKTPRVLDVKGFAGAEISGVRIYNSTFKGITKEDVVQEADVKLVDCTVEKKK